MKKMFFTALICISLLILSSCNVSLTKTSSSSVGSSEPSIVTSTTPSTTPNTTTSTSISTTKPSTTPSTTPNTTTNTTISTTKPSTIPSTTPTPVQYFIVSIYLNNELIEEKEVKAGELITLNNPVKEGYNFIGWFTDNSYTTKFDFNTNITTDTKIYAKFEVQTFTIHFINSNIANQEIQYNSYVNKPADPIKDDYEFVGWFTDDSYTTEFDFNTPITKETSIYAKFEKIANYTVYFTVDGEEYKSIVINANTSVNKPENPTKSNYNFIGWFTNIELTEEFNFTSKINSNITLYAKFEEINVEELSINITSQSGYNEGLYIEFDVINTLTNATDYTIYYKNINNSSYITVDSELIRINSNTIRCDILGLSKGIYIVKIECTYNEKLISVESKELNVTAYDRSGYAHFNYSEGVGAYNNNGTPKNNALIVYVTEATKNTVTATINGKKYTGIVNIIAAQSNSSNPLIVRIIGTIGAATWKQITYSGNALSSTSVKGLNGSVLPQQNLEEETIISGGYNNLDESKYTKLNGLTNKIKYSSGEFDSYYNMADIKNAKNVTIEGVGPNAMLFQWGFTWKNCSSIEIRNLIFDDYTEDACSFEASETGVSTLDSFKTGNIWVHHNTFNEGKNYWDVCYEQDKHEGDGATDFKGNKNITLSYNHYYKNHKTGLVGGSDSNSTANITFHHNYYDQCSSRLPLGRQANMHMYNNYYYKSSGTNMSLRAGAYAFIENCIFESCNNPIEVKTNATYGNAVAKIWNSTFTGCSGSNGATTVKSRTEIVSNSNKFAPSFDTNSETFYYDSTNKISDVEIMTELSNVKEYVIANAGAMSGQFISNDSSNSTNPDNDNNEDENNNNNTDNGETIITPITSSTLITFEDFSTGSISSNTSSSNCTITIKSGKIAEIKTCEETIESTTINKYINFGGGGNYSQLSIQFKTTKKANITVYYSGGSGRYAKLFSDSEAIETATTATIDASTVVSYKFENIEVGNYAITSAGSGMQFYCILIEYIE